MHLADNAVFLHPRKGNTNIDEDYVGLIKRLVHSCVCATDQNAVPHAAMEKIRWRQYFAAMYGNEFKSV